MTRPLLNTMLVRLRACDDVTRPPTPYSDRDPMLYRHAEILAPDPCREDGVEQEWEKTVP